ncbi:hypothetical protein D3C85_1930780 [compost metagenome]
MSACVYAFNPSATNAPFPFTSTDAALDGSVGLALLEVTVVDALDDTVIAL